MSVTMSLKSSIDDRVVDYLRNLIGEGAAILTHWALVSNFDDPHILRVGLGLKAAPHAVISRLTGARSISWDGQSRTLDADLLINIYDLLGIEQESS